MALVLRASGADPENIDVNTLSLEAIQRIVAGYFERVQCRLGVLYVNEEARLTGLPFNSDASAIAGQSIRGDAIFLSTAEEKELNGEYT